MDDAPLNPFLESAVRRADDDEEAVRVPSGLRPGSDAAPGLGPVSLMGSG